MKRKHLALTIAAAAIIIFAATLTRAVFYAPDYEAEPVVVFDDAPVLIDESAATDGLVIADAVTIDDGSIEASGTATSSGSANPGTVVLAPETAISPKEPVTLSIPSLSIDTDVQKVGIKTTGEMANPNNFTDVGWYKYGTLPGEVGSAVMAGHVDNGLSLAGVFKELDTVSIGADIFVTTSGGEKIRYIVTDIESYPYDSAPAELVFGRKDKARLNLITCGGTWLPEKKTYDKRLVVFAELAL